jgi:hypothetical protein
MDKYLKAAIRLHEYTATRHWDGEALIGLDPIGKFHWRVTRFVRSYFPWLPGEDRYLYLQGQGYWIQANLALFELTSDPKYLDYSIRCAENLVQNQPANGAWLHPPIWGRWGFIVVSAYSRAM